MTTFDHTDNFRLNETPTPLFDLKFLNDFDNNSLKMKLLETFVRTVPEMCEDLRNAFLTRDYKNMKDTAHKLKPNIEMMGIAMISEAIRNVEYSSSRNENSMQKDVDLILNVLLEVVKEFKVMISKM